VLSSLTRSHKHVLACLHDLTSNHTFEQTTFLSPPQTFSSCLLSTLYASANCEKLRNDFRFVAYKYHQLTEYKSSTSVRSDIDPTMGTLIRVLIATSLLFVIAESSLKYDTKLDKEAFIGGQENDLEYVAEVGETPENMYLCYWSGSAPFCDAGWCTKGYSTVFRSSSSATSFFAEDTSGYVQ
ncbi:hypothetical protein PMAYCL1PPCAC_27017, partial [Pristionchus mayeri]